MTDQTDPQDAGDEEPKEGSKAWLERELEEARRQLAEAQGPGAVPFHERSGAVTINAKGEVQR